MARYAGPARPGDTSTLDQLHALQHEISAYMVDRATRPIMADYSAAIRDYSQAQIRVLGILDRCQSLLLAIEWDVEHG